MFWLKIGISSNPWKNRSLNTNFAAIHFSQYKSTQSYSWTSAWKWDISYCTVHLSVCHILPPGGHGGQQHDGHSTDAISSCYFSQPKTYHTFFFVVIGIFIQIREERRLSQTFAPTHCLSANRRQVTAVTFLHLQLLCISFFLWSARNTCMRLQTQVMKKKKLYFFFVDVGLFLTLREHTQVLLFFFFFPPHFFVFTSCYVSPTSEMKTHITKLMLAGNLYLNTETVQKNNKK